MTQGNHRTPEQIEGEIIVAHNISDKSNGHPTKVKRQERIRLFDLAAKFLANGGNPERLTEILEGNGPAP